MPKNGVVKLLYYCCSTWLIRVITIPFTRKLNLFTGDFLVVNTPSMLNNPRRRIEWHWKWGSFEEVEDNCRTFIITTYNPKEQYPNIHKKGSWKFLLILDEVCFPNTTFCRTRDSCKKENERRVFTYKYSCTTTYFEYIFCILLLIDELLVLIHQQKHKRGMITFTVTVLIM